MPSPLLSWGLARDTATKSTISFQTREGEPWLLKLLNVQADQNEEFRNMELRSGRVHCMLSFVDHRHPTASVLQNAKLSQQRSLFRNVIVGILAQIAM